MRRSEWVDLEALLIDRMTQELALSVEGAEEHRLEVSTDLPPDLGQRWFIRLRMISGSDDGITETSRIDVDAFTDDRGTSQDIAQEIRGWFEDLGGTSREDGTGLVDYVRTTQRPVWVNYSNPQIQCFQGSYQVSMRQQ